MCKSTVGLLVWASALQRCEFSRAVLGLSVGPSGFSMFRLKSSASGDGSGGSGRPGNPVLFPSLAAELLAPLSVV